MNKSRRKELSSIITELENLKERLDFLSEEEQEAADNMPESLQGSHQFFTMEENVSEIDDANEELSAVIDTLQEVIGK